MRFDHINIDKNRSGIQYLCPARFYILASPLQNLDLVPAAAVITEIRFAVDRHFGQIRTVSPDLLVSQ